MPKCIYRDKDNNKCYCSTSGHHLDAVTERICSKCCSIQASPTVTKETRLRQVIKEAKLALKDNDPQEALRILNCSHRI